MSYLSKFPMSCRGTSTAFFWLVTVLAISFQEVLAQEPDIIPPEQDELFDDFDRETLESEGAEKDGLRAFADLEENDESSASKSLDLSLPYNSLIEEDNWVHRLWGRPFRDRLYLGMWTLHFQDGKDQEDENQLIGASWKGYFGGTFINTHGDRVFSAGVQRTVFQQNYGELEVEAGYRAGMMYGYKRYLTLYDTRLFPLLQAVLDIEYKQFGVELSWAGVVVTAGLYYRF